MANQTDFEIIASTVESNLEALNGIYAALADGSLAASGEDYIINAYEQVVNAQQNAITCYTNLINAVDNVPFMIAASADDDVFGNAVIACQKLGTKADILANVMASEFGIVSEEDEEEDSVETLDEVENDVLEDEEEDDGGDFDDQYDDTQSVVAAEEVVKASLNKVAASEEQPKPVLFDFLTSY